MFGAGGEHEQRAANPNPCPRTDTSELFTWDHGLAYDNPLFLEPATVLETSRESNRIGSDTIDQGTDFPV